MWVPVEDKRESWGSWAVVTGSCEPLDVGTLELNSGPLEEQHVLLTIKTSL